MVIFGLIVAVVVGVVVFLAVSYFVRSPEARRRTSQERRPAFDLIPRSVNHEGGIWIASPRLQADEIVRLKGAASRFSSHRRLGGRVTVTDRRFVFLPNRLDALLGGRGAEFPLSAIRDIRLNPGGREAMRERGLGALKRDQVEIDVQMAENPVTDTLVVIVRDPKLLMANLG